MLQQIWQLKKWCGLSFGVLLLGCSQPTETSIPSETVGVHLPDRVSQLIGSTQPIETLSRDRVDQTLQIEGTVSQAAPLLEDTLYQLTDATGTVWVRSADTAPAINDTVRVTGVLQYQEIVISDIDLGEYYLQETTRTAVEAAPEVDALPQDAPQDEAAPAVEGPPTQE
ncbi:MAG: hypothetical protein ACFB12_15595 [Leptolyngbyaceae cyanobacterium]